MKKNKRSVMNQVGNSKIPPSGHLIFFLPTYAMKKKTREIQKWPRARDRTSLMSLRCVFIFIQIKHYQILSNKVCEPHRRVQIKQHNNLFNVMIFFVNAGINE
jgi:hypothetical protein